VLHTSEVRMTFMFVLSDGKVQAEEGRGKQVYDTA
jgi:hypothetical protein